MLRDVDLDVPRGAVTALVGVNGSGKTTLLRTLIGLLPPLGGSIRAAGGRRPRLGYVPQADASDVLFPVTAEQVVLMGCTPRLGWWRRPGRAERAAAAACLERFGVADLAGRFFRDLSGGQRQRVLLARALVDDPQLVVLDEPVRGLDLTSAAALVALLSDLSRTEERAVLVATHSLDLVANHADHLALFRDGRVTAGPADELFTDERLSAFLGAPVVVGAVAGQRVVVPAPDEGTG